MANLNKALHEVLRDWGHDVILQRKHPSGCGWGDTLERHTVRHMYPATRGLPQIMQEQPEGITHLVDMVYYFKADAHPREGDRIYERDDRYIGHDSPAGSGQTTWLIDYALPMRGYGGKIVFYTVGVTREEPN